MFVFKSLNSLSFVCGSQQKSKNAYLDITSRINIPQKRSSENFRKLPRKAPTLDCIFHKVANIDVPTPVLFLGIIFKYSEELLVKKSYYVKILKIKQNSSTFTKAQKILDSRLRRFTNPRNRGSCSQIRSSLQGCSVKKGNCKERCSQKFRKFHRKTPVWKSLFNKVVGLQACNFIKKTLQHRCFPVKLALFLRPPILKNICERLLLTDPAVFQFLKIMQNSKGRSTLGVGRQGISTPNKF